MKFSEFNQVVNLNDENVYIVESSAQKIQKLSFEEVKQIFVKYPDALIKIKLPKGYMVIETDNPTVLEIIKDNKEQVMVVEYNKKYTIWCKGMLNTDTVNNVLACGIDANVLAKKGTEVILPFAKKTIATNPYYKDATIVYSNGITECPNWLKPLFSTSATTSIGIQMPIVNNAQMILQKHIQNLVSFNKYDQEDIINIINKYFIASPLTPTELKNLIQVLNNNLLNSFIDKGQLMHWKLGDYVIKACSIKREEDSKDLFFYDTKKKIYVNDSDFLMGYLTKLLLN